MTAFDRRRFLRTATAAAILGTAAASTARPTAEPGWQYRTVADQGSSFAHVQRTDEGYLAVGSARDEPFTTEGVATALAPGGETVWSERYLSPPQRETREREIATGPVPEDWLSFSLETADGYLLVGWTYYDSTAVDVARVYRVAADGTVLETHDLGDLENAAAYSHLADGVETGDGFLCCGIESPGVSLGGAGWLVWLDDDGAVDRHERYPATDRDLEQTTRRDVFNAIAATDGGYVVAGACELERTEPAHGWVVGLDESGNVRWDDRFALPGDEPTVVYDVEPSESDQYDLLVVGATGTNLQRATATRFDVPPGDETRIDGDGFVAAYTAEGEQRWLETLSDTPLFCAESTAGGILAGGARDGRGWVGTVSRTAFHADHESVVASLSRSHRDGLIAAGRATDGDRVEGWVRALEDVDGDPEEEPTSEETKEDADDGESETDETEDEQPRDGEPVEFVDCLRARLVGDYDDVILRLVFEAEDGMPGTITEPVGGVDGERVVDGAAEFGLPPDRTVLASVELFEDEGVATPGLGDLLVENPDLEACERDRLEGESSDATGETPADEADGPEAENEGDGAEPRDGAGEDE
ncbi:hypothetical protein [Natrononativus amylolyticus]|uniref:hypothetical protein n=1 Tax=Natrononativus amylolyticus TaxID=2963434 RepID=UPI0020CCE4B7|nr:hypothetical protein [Natrononativus amylolyticus]